MTTATTTCCNHSTQNGHDARQQRRTRSRSAAVLGVLVAAALSSNTNNGGVMAFAPVAAPASRFSSTTVLQVSSAVDYDSSLAEQMMGEMTAVVRAKAPLQQKTNNNKVQKMSKKASAAAADAYYSSTMTPYLSEEEVMRRKLEWAGKYTSVEALRETFGTNQNKLWGDLQATTARRLYKTLLPRALVELSQLGVGQLQPQDLAPLAYQARVAAKLYARERCTVPARIGATLFDGFRQWIKYGKFQAHGMTYDQLWEKYSEKICQETEQDSFDEQDICLKIIERSCVSNEGVDALVLHQHHRSNNKNNHSSSNTKEQQQLLERIHSQLEQDMYQLLLPNVEVCSGDDDESSSSSTSNSNASRKVCKRRRPWSKRNHVLIVRLLAKQRRILQFKYEQEQKAAAELKP